MQFLCKFLVQSKKRTGELQECSLRLFMMLYEVSAKRDGKAIFSMPGADQKDDKTRKVN